MRRNSKNSEIWAYLNASGVLEKGTEEDIKKVKKAYRKQYLLNFKRKQRAKKPEFAVSLSKDNGEYSKISAVAKTHKTSVPAFLRMATLAYINKTYIVPDRLLVARLEQLLSQCINEIQLIVHQKERYFWGKEQKFKDIEKRIKTLEVEITEAFKHPPTIEETILREINKKPELKGRLFNILASQ